MRICATAVFVLFLASSVVVATEQDRQEEENERFQQLTSSTPALEKQRCARIQNARWDTQRLQCMCRHGWMGPFCTHSWCGGARIGLWDGEARRCVCAFGYDGGGCDRCLTSLGSGVGLYCCRTRAGGVHVEGDSDRWTLAMLTLEAYESLNLRLSHTQWQCVPNDDESLQQLGIGCACEHKTTTTTTVAEYRALFNASEEREYWTQRERAWRGEERAQPLAWTSAAATMVGAALSDMVWQGERAISRPELVQAIAEFELAAVNGGDDDDDDGGGGNEKAYFIAMLAVCGFAFLLCLLVIGMLVYITHAKKKRSNHTDLSPKITTTMPSRQDLSGLQYWNRLQQRRRP